MSLNRSPLEAPTFKKWNEIKCHVQKADNKRLLLFALPTPCSMNMSCPDSKLVSATQRAYKFSLIEPFNQHLCQWNMMYRPICTCQKFSYWTWGNVHIRFMDQLMGVQAVELSTGSYFKHEHLFPHGGRLSLYRKTQSIYYCMQMCLSIFHKFLTWLGQLLFNCRSYFSSELAK